MRIPYPPDGRVPVRTAVLLGGILVLLAGEARALRAQSSGPASGGKLLFDYREPHHGQPSLSDAERARIVAAVKKKVEWEDADGESDADDEIWINSVVPGAFTRPGARETAYMLQPGGPRAMEPHSTMDTVLAVFSGKKLVAAAQAAGWNFILTAADVDGDGVDELLVDGSFMTFGVLMTSARLVRLKDDDLETVHDFGGVYEGGCAGPTNGVLAAVLRYDPPAKGDTPAFRADVWGAPCGPEGADPKRDAFRHKPGEQIAW